MDKVALFGTVFMDIKGFAADNYDPVGRNVGDVKFIHGGVGRNIAENLAVLGVPVIFGATVDKSGVGDEIVERLNNMGVMTEFIRRTDKDGMGMWLAILDKKGDLAGSISSMPDLALFEEMIDDNGGQAVEAAGHVALEIDLNESIARKVIALAKQYNKPVYGLPGNMSVTLAHPELISALDCFICNDIEAAKLFDVSFKGKTPLEIGALLEYYMEKNNIKAMIVTMGEKGAVYFKQGMAVSCYMPVRPVKMIDSTGAGDSFFSGVVCSIVRGQGLHDAVKFAARVAAHTIQSEESTCRGFAE